MVIQFSSLLKERTSGGIVDYSEMKPKFELDGKQWTVGFSDHAIKRICERIHPRDLSFRDSDPTPTQR